MQFALSRPAAGLLLRPGLGKTAIMLHVFKLLKSKGIVSKMLVVGTRRIIHDVWPREVEKWELNLRVSIVHGGSKARALAADADVYLINYEGLPWLAQKPQAAARAKLQMLVLDESTKIKSWRAQRTRSLVGMLNGFMRRYILTGTPAPNSLMDLFSQVYMLDAGATLGRFITQYRLRYFHPAGYKGYNWEPNPGAEQHIFEVLRPLVLRIETDEIKLPSLTVNDILVELPEGARRFYTQLEKELVVEWKSGLVVAGLAITRTMKLRQIANGTLYSATKEATAVHDAKLDALEELLEELGGDPAIVCYDFNHDLRRILERLGKSTPVLGGGMSDKDANRIIEAWNAGRVPVLLAQTSVISHGLNLQEAGRVMVFFSLDWNLENYEQAIARLRRQGQRRPVILHRIVAARTVDATVAAALERKANLQDALLKALESSHD